jgi:hypothetical protein
MAVSFTLVADFGKREGDGSFDGLVVSYEVVPQLPASEHFVPFDAHHVWIPYTGDLARCDWGR